MATNLVPYANGKCFVYSGGALSCTKLVFRYSIQMIETNNPNSTEQVENPNCMRQTSWLFTSVAEERNSRLPRINSQTESG